MAIVQLLKDSHFFNRALLQRIAGIALGASMPLTALGRGYSAAALLIAMASILLQGEHAKRLADLQSALRSPIGLAAVVVFVVWLPSVWLSLDIAKSAVVWGRMAAYLAGGVIVWSYLSADIEARRHCGRAFILSAIAVSLLGYVNFLGLTELLQFIQGGGWVAYTATGSLKAFGSVAACLAPALLLIGWRLGGKWRGLGALATLGVVSILLLTKSGAGLIGLTAGSLLATVALILRFKPPAMGAIFALALAATVGGLVWLDGHRITDYADSTSYPLPTHEDGPVGLDAHRQAIWLFALKKSAEAPWFGHGIDASNKIEGANTKIPAFNQELIPSHPHNWLIEVLVDTGRFGFSALILAFAVLYWGIFQTATPPHQAPKRPSSRDIMLALCALYGAYLTSSLLNFSFWASWWELNFIILWAIIAAERRRV